MELSKVLESFRAHGFAVTYFDTASEAKAYLLGECAGKTVSFGGSMTLDGMGVYEALRDAGETVSWQWKDGGGYVQDSDVYLTSANALSETGEIVNLDGRGNRVAAAIYGPKACFTVCGVNKLMPTLEAAVKRVREVAAPRNAQRLSCKTPCAVDGKCHDCRSPGRICRALTILLAPPIGFERCELVLIGETLGY